MAPSKAILRLFCNIFISTGSQRLYNCTTCTVPVRFIKIFLPNGTRLIIKKKQDVGNDLVNIIEYFSQPNLTNGTLKEPQEDPVLIRPDETWITIL